MGTRKLQAILLETYGLRIGRDKLFSLLRSNNLLVKIKHKQAYIARSISNRVANKYKDFKVSRPGQVMLTDITYLKSKTNDYYLSLIVDAYSRNIIGHHLSNKLMASESIIALDKAINSSKYNYLLHHSDGGSQYTSQSYKEYLAEHNITQSMTSPGSPQENAIVERINGILKHEYALKQVFNNFEAMQDEVNRVIQIYNTQRPHWSLGLCTPAFVHEKSVNLF